MVSLISLYFQHRTPKTDSRYACVSDLNVKSLFYLTVALTPLLAKDANNIGELESLKQSEFSV